MVHVSARYYKDQRIAQNIEKFVSSVLTAFNASGTFTVSLVRAVKGDAKRQGIVFKTMVVNGVQCVIQPGDNGTCNVVNITTSDHNSVSKLQECFLLIFSSGRNRLSLDEIEEMSRGQRGTAKKGCEIDVRAPVGPVSEDSSVVPDADEEVSVSLIGFTRNQINIECSILAVYEIYGDHPFKYDDFYKLLRENGLCNDSVNGHQLAQIIAWLFRHGYLSKSQDGERMAMLASKSIKILEAAQIKKSTNTYGAKLTELESQAKAYEVASIEMQAANMRIGELNQEIDLIQNQIRDLTIQLNGHVMERSVLLRKIDEYDSIASNPLYCEAGEKLRQILKLLA